MLDEQPRQRLQRPEAPVGSVAAEEGDAARVLHLRHPVHQPLLLVHGTVPLDLLVALLLLLLLLLLGLDGQALPLRQVCVREEVLLLGRLALLLLLLLSLEVVLLLLQSHLLSLFLLLLLDRLLPLVFCDLVRPQLDLGLPHLGESVVDDVADGGEAEDLVHEAVEDLELLAHRELEHRLGGERLHDLGLLHPEAEAGVVGQTVASPLLVEPHDELLAPEGPGGGEVQAQNLRDAHGVHVKIPELLALGLHGPLRHCRGGLDLVGDVLVLSQHVLVQVVSVRRQLVHFDLLVLLLLQVKEDPQEELEDLVHIVVDPAAVSESVLQDLEGEPVRERVLHLEQLREVVHELQDDEEVPEELVGDAAVDRPGPGHLFQVLALQVLPHLLPLAHELSQQLLLLLLALLLLGLVLQPLPLGLLRPLLHLLLEPGVLLPHPLHFGFQFCRRLLLALGSAGGGSLVALDPPVQRALLLALLLLPLLLVVHLALGRVQRGLAAQALQPLGLLEGRNGSGEDLLECRLGVLCPQLLLDGEVVPLPAHLHQVLEEEEVLLPGVSALLPAHVLGVHDDDLVDLGVVRLHLHHLVAEEVVGRGEGLLVLGPLWAGLALLGRLLALLLGLLGLLRGVLVHLLLRGGDHPEDLAVAPLVLDDGLHDLAHEEAVVGEHVDVVHQVGHPAPLGPARQVEEGPLQGPRHGQQPLPGLPLALHRLLVGQVGLARHRAGPHQAVAEDGALEELVVVPEHLLGGLAQEDLVLRPEVLGGGLAREGLLAQQGHGEGLLGLTRKENEASAS